MKTAVAQRMMHLLCLFATGSQSRWQPHARPSPPSDYNSEPESDHDGQALPILVRNVSTQPQLTTLSRPLPPTSPVAQISQQDSDVRSTQHAPPIRRTIPPTPTGQPDSFDHPGPTSPPISTPTLSVSGSEEILDDEEGGAYIAVKLFMISI